MTIFTKINGSNGMTDKFRLYCDGNLYYVGLCKELGEQKSAFQPLDRAMNDVGSTRMDYRKRGVGEWKSL